MLVVRLRPNLGLYGKTPLQMRRRACGALAARVAEAGEVALHSPGELRGEPCQQLAVAAEHPRVGQHRGERHALLPGGPVNKVQKL